MPGRKRGQATDQEVTPWARQPRRHQKKHRDKPSSHTNLVGCGGETEWDIPKVGCGSLIGKESEGVSTSCWLELVGGVSL